MLLTKIRVMAIIIHFRMVMEKYFYDIVVLFDKKKTEQRDKRIVFYNRRKYAHSISTTDDKFCDFGTLDLNEKLFNYPSCPSHIHIHFFYYSIIKPLRQSDL